MFRALKRFSPFNDVNAFGISFPSVHEAKWLTEQSMRSPDLGFLEQQEFQLIFSPDDTRLGYERYELISDGAPLATAYTQDTFAYWMQEIIDPKGNTERIPIPMRQQTQSPLRYVPPALKIKGEVHAIRPWQFRGLDDYKRNKEQFRRQRVNVLIPYRMITTGDKQPDGSNLPPPLFGKKYQIEYPERIHILRCWMYVGVPEYWDDILDAGFRGFKTVNHYETRRPWLKEYYDFPKHPLKE